MSVPNILSTRNPAKLKVTQLMADYLIQNHSLLLPGFGTITYDGSIQYTREGDSEKFDFPNGSLVFQFNPKVKEEEELVNFISRETGKMRSLALSDLQSYLHFGHELINISKPFHIEGIGTLQKNARNEIEFIQEDAGKGSDAYVRMGQRRQGKDSLAMNAQGDADRRTFASFLRRNIIIVLAGLMMAAAIGVFFYLDGDTEWLKRNLTLPKRVDAAPATEDKPPVKETAPAPVTRQRFNIVLEQSSKTRATRRYESLRQWGHNVVMTTTDSQTYKLSFPIDAPLADSAYHRDSLRRFFNKRVWVEVVDE